MIDHAGAEASIATARWRICPGLVRQLLECGPQCALALDRRRNACTFDEAAQKTSGLLRTQVIAEILRLTTLGIGNAGGEPFIVFGIFAFGGCIEIGERKAET